MHFKMINYSLFRLVLNNHKTYYADYHNNLLYFYSIAAWLPKTGLFTIDICSSERRTLKAS